MKHTFVVTGACAALFGASHASASVLTEWNLIVRQNLVTTSEVDGSALVGGSVLGTSNYSTHLITASNGAGLAVGGNIGAGINVQINNGGDLRIAGSVLGNANMNGGGSIITDPTVPAQVTAAMAEASGISTHLASLVANGTVDGGGNMSAVPVNLGGQLVAVYTITQAQFDAWGGINLNIGSANSVVINFIANGSGIADLIAPPNIIGGFSQANSSKIIWNFPNASVVKVNNSFNGALLAPNADLQLTGGGINGSVAVDSISVMNAEIRRFNYNGYVPAPGAIAIAGLAGAVVARRRRG